MLSHVSFAVTIFLSDIAVFSLSCLSICGLVLPETGTLIIANCFVTQMLTQNWNPVVLKSIKLQQVMYLIVMARAPQNYVHIQL